MADEIKVKVGDVTLTFPAGTDASVIREEVARAGGQAAAPSEADIATINAATDQALYGIPRELRTPPNRDPGLHLPQTDQGVDNGVMDLYTDAEGQSWLNPNLPEIPTIPDSMTDVFGTPIEDTLQWRLMKTFGNGMRDLGYAVPKAARDLGVGLSTLIADIFGADEAGDWIGSNVPRIQTESGLQDIEAGVLQFGAPAAGAANLAGKALMGAPKAATVLGELLAAGAADVASVDPRSQNTSLGNLIPGAPTAIQPDDGPREIRLKIGSEGFVLPSFLLGAGKVMAPPLRMARDLASGMIGPIARSQVENATARALQSVAIDRIKAAQEIEASLARNADTPPMAMPMTGEASNDTGLIGLQRSMSSDAPIAQRARDQATFNDTQRQSVTQAMDGNPESLRATVLGAVDDGRQAAAQSVDAAKLKEDLARAELDRIMAPISAEQGTKGAASVDLDRQIRGILDDMTARKNDLFRSIDPSNEVMVSSENMLNAVDAALAPRSELDMIPAKVEKYAGDVLASIRQTFDDAGNRTGGLGAEVAFGALQDLRPDLAAAIARARADGEGGVVERLTQIKAALEDETRLLAEAGGDAGERAAEAMRFFQEDFAPRFRQGEGGDYANMVRRDVTSPGSYNPSETGNRFLGGGAAQIERADALKRIMEGTETDPATIRQFLIGDMADFVTRADGTIDPNKMTTWLNRRSDVLMRFPDIAREITAMRNQVRSGVENLNEMGRAVADAAAAQTRTEREIAQSAARLFLDERDPVAAVGRALTADNAAAQMSDLVRLARADSSGAAMDGLKRSVGDWLESQMTNTGRDADNALMNSLNKVEKLFGNEETMRALRMIFSDDEIAKLNRVRERMAEFDRRNLRVTTGSDTAALQAGKIDKARIVMAAAFGIVKGRGVFMISKWLRDMVAGDPKVAIEALLQRAMLDPDLARIMLMRDLGTDGSPAAKALRLYLTNNYPQMLASDGPDEGNAPDSE